MKIIRTPQGSTIDMDKPARASFITKLSLDGRSTDMYDVRLTGKTSTYEEFGEPWTEFEAEDWDGSLINISEKDIIQY